MYGFQYPISFTLKFDFNLLEVKTIIKIMYNSEKNCKILNIRELKKSVHTFNKICNRVLTD